MNKLLAAFIAGAFAFACVSAMAQGDKTVTPTTPEEQAKMKAERVAAKAKWEKMTPEEKAATRKGMQAKRLSELTALEKVGQEDDVAPTTPDESAKLKAERDAAQAKWIKMTPEERAATRKAAQSKRVSELTELEKMSQHGE